MSTRIPSTIALLALLMPGAAMAHHVSVGSSSEHAGPINTVSPATLEKGRWAIGVRTQIIDFNSFSDEFLEDVALSGIEEVHNTDSIIVPSLSLYYGITERLEVSLKLPYFFRNGIREAHAHDDHAELHVMGDSDGIGDLVAFGKYRFLDVEDRGLGMALLAGLRMPTGETSERDDHGDLFETEFQPGAGAWSPMAGLSAGRNIGQVAVNASVLYTFSGEGAQDTDLGDELGFAAALSYRLERGVHDHFQGTAEEHGHACWDFILELDGEWQKREFMAGEADIHSGGTQLFIAPGVRYNAAQGWGIFLSVGFQVYEDLNGIQNDTDIKGNAGVGITF